MSGGASQATIDRRVKPLVLNKTNFESIEAIAGDEETDDWGGTRVVLFPTTTRMRGVLTPCVRIKEQRIAAPVQTSLEGVQAAF